jgi:GNAT superfamily N-acetyltransferase
MEYHLHRVETDQQWEAYHAIRRRELFPEGDYICDHPDEMKPSNHALLFSKGIKPIGTARLDFIPHDSRKCVLRLLAITHDEQGRGHGRHYLSALERYALERGVSHMHVNAVPEAVDYYTKMGFSKQKWNPQELHGIAENCIQMTKIIRTVDRGI